MIRLSEFQSDDIPQLIEWIPDAKFLMQWAGRKYTYPLDASQLQDALEKTKGSRPSSLMFKAAHSREGTVVGHIELDIDYEKSTAMLGRVLVGPEELRGRGYGRRIVSAALDVGFREVCLDRISLGVFDFNLPAMRCYEGLGFQKYETREDWAQVGDQYWTVVMMELTRISWLNHEEQMRVDCQQS